MIITKRTLQLLKFIYKKNSISYQSLQKHFKNKMIPIETLSQLVRKEYLIQVGGYFTNMGDSIPITANTVFQLDNLGIAEVESKQFFNAEFAIKQILLPIVIALLTYALTYVLSHINF